MLTIKTNGKIEKKTPRERERSHLETKTGTLVFDEKHFKFEQYNVPYRNIEHAVLSTTHVLFFSKSRLIIDDGMRVYTFGPIMRNNVAKHLPFTVSSEVHRDWLTNIALIAVIVMLLALLL